MDTTTRIGMPLDEFIRVSDTEGRFELLDGERIPVTPTLTTRLGHTKQTACGLSGL